MRDSGPACGAKKGTCRRSRWRSCRPSASASRSCSAVRCRSTPAPLTKVAPAVERPGIHLGVWRFGDELRVWGTTRAIPGVRHGARSRGAGPARHQASSRRRRQVRERGGARRRSDQDHRRACVAAARLPGDAHVAARVRLAGLTRRTRERARRPGRLDACAPTAAASSSMVPSFGDEWRQSIVHPIPYAIDPPFTALADLMRRADEEHELRAWQEELEDLVDHVAGLTAVDGATILTDRCEVLAIRRENHPAQGFAAGRRVRRHRANRRAAKRRSFIRRCSAARAIWQRRSSCSTSATPWRWSRRRMVALRCSSGRHARSACTRTGSRRCCCSARSSADL